MVKKIGKSATPLKKYYLLINRVQNKQKIMKNIFKNSSYLFSFLNPTQEQN